MRVLTAMIAIMSLCFATLSFATHEGKHKHHNKHHQQKHEQKKEEMEKK